MNSSNSLHLERPTTEVTAKARRRSFTAEYKKKILKEADACREPGQIGALLRREGLYSSHLVMWRAARERGELTGLSPKKRGPKAKAVNPLVKELAAKERENAQLKAENAKLRLVCEAQKKVSELLGIALPPMPEDDDSSGSSS